MSPRIVWRAARPGLKVGSAGVLRISPSRATDRRAWWKSCQIWASRSTGALTRPANILNATSLPTERLPSMTSLAPKNKTPAVTSLLELNRLACHIAEAENSEARGDIACELFFPAPLHL